MSSRPGDKHDVPFHVRSTPTEVVSYSRGAFSLYSRGTLALIGIALFSGAITWATGSSFWGWLSLGLLSLGLAPELIPTRYTLGSQGITRQLGPWRQQFNWLEVTDYEVSSQGVWVVVNPPERPSITFLIPFQPGGNSSAGRQELVDLFDYYVVFWHRDDVAPAVGGRVLDSRKGKPHPSGR